MMNTEIRRVAAIGTGTIGASWVAVFLARGLSVAASDPAPGADHAMRSNFGVFADMRVVLDHNVRTNPHPSPKPGRR